MDKKLSVLDAKLTPGTNWHDILLEGALSFASQGILVVCPPTLVISDACGKTARRLGKSISRLSLAHFTAQERRRIRSSTSIGGLYLGPADRNDPKVVSSLVAQFKHLMKSRW